ncbi:type IX secretion system membrane protein PorP/SprF [Crocinitomicaceae bacterium]|nr:type IX secretion system membrane protein PorP/SprF [Crocinitomicaceae bacterium]
MTSPNFENIDLWLFDYTEGNLSVYQKELLEQYILNHPELEIDLDMWNMSKVSISTDFVDTLELKKKRTSRFSYYATSFIGVLIILLISKSNDLNIYNNGLNKTRQVSYLQHVENNKISTKIFSNSASPKLETPIKTSTSGASDILNNNKTKILSSTINKDPINNDFNATSALQLKSKTMDLALQRMPLQLTELLLQDNVSEALNTTSHTKSQKKNLSLNGLRLKTKTLFNKIDRALSKSIAFSNYRDHFYIIPGVASNNVNLSTTGSVSQSRFISSSRARWLNSSNEKLSQEFSFDTYLRSIRSGFGAQLNYDTYANGSIQDWNAAIVFSPKIALSRNISIEPAAKLKIGNKLLNSNQINNNSLSLYDQNNPQTFSFDSTQKIGRKLWYRDIDVGFTLNTKVFYLGFQAENILNHIENLYQNEQNNDNRISTTYSALAGTQYMSRDKKVSFHPYVYLRTNTQTTAYYGGFSFDIDKIFVGASYGSSNQYSGSIGLSMDQFALIIQSTRAFQPILNETLYTHQLTLRINSPISKKTRRYITL